MNLDFPIYHVIVVGFHHKRGCQVISVGCSLFIIYDNSAVGVI